MFVPRAVKRKPAKSPAASTASTKKKADVIPVNTVINTQTTSEFKHIDHCNTSHQTLDRSKSTNSIDAGHCISALGKEIVTENEVQKTTLCQGESSVIKLEGSSTNFEAKPTPAAGVHSHIKCPSQGFLIKTDTVPLQLKCKDEDEVLGIKKDSTISNVYKEGSEFGVSSGIHGGSDLPGIPIDIAAIRKSIANIKRDGRLASLTTPSKKEEGVVTTDNTDEKNGQIDEEHESDEEEVVSYSKNQRWPVDDEPVCVICGRYGAYICDQTEFDICSRECKARNLARLGKTSATNQLSTPAPEQVNTTKVIIEEPEPIGYMYQEHEEISDLTKEQVQEIRAQVDIFVEGMDIPRPIIEFSHLVAPKKMEANLANVGYNMPTPVQMQVIPAALRWRDMMVCAQTSSGKTAAFLVPTILQIYNTVCFRDSKEEGSKPLGLILSPSRELAMQIEEQAKQLMQGLPNMRTALVVGGLPMPTQLHRLKQDIQFIIATPGRILDVIQKEGVSLTAIKTVIIDEVDTMLHKGFKQQVLDVMSHLPNSHQTMLFSATIPQSMENVAASLLYNPLYISIGKPNTPCTSVKQIVMWVEEPAKKKNLFAVLQDPKHYRPPLVVFVDSKIGAGLLSLAINKTCDIRAASLHGDRPQSERTETLQCFRDGEYPVLVCTAVLGRGIDLPGVRMVVNFDMPNTVEEYIHQIGRTGRLGSKGKAITFINNGSKNLFLEFVNTVKPLGVPLPPQLINSTHLHYQQQGHRTWQQDTRWKRERKNCDDEDAGEGRRQGGNESYFGYKRRKQEASAVGELLKKRKHKKGNR
ncbi:probable ATP-dependent RNA helicase DDX59 [Asterias amurensis]|uniref:probable ATP-dependent RNA helicase DDX59 n=1 Tax=Asterias amurensis TaxID=7602 RepID=UPI003AB59216